MINGTDLRYLKDIAALDQAIHTPARLMAISLLYNTGSLDFIQLMTHTELTWGNLSTHLTKLEEAGYVMITKTFKGKRPHTLISLTESGRQAYLQWGRTVIKALPEQVMRTAFPAVKEAMVMPILPAALQREAGNLPQGGVFFLPKYHQWGPELPPIRELTQLA